MLTLLALANVAAWLVWSDWSARLAVLFVSLVVAPMLVGLVARRT